MKVYSIQNNKGGVGKSETAINLSVECGKAGLRTLLISLDPQSNSTNRILKAPKKHSREALANLMNDYKKMNNREENPNTVMNAYKVLHEYVRKPLFDCDVSDVLEEPQKITQAIVKSNYENLWVLPSTNRLVDTDMKLKLSGKSPSGRLRRALAFVDKDYDIVIIDNAPFENGLTFNSMCACYKEGDKIVIPMKIDEGGFEGLDATLTTLFDWLNSEALDYDFKILITMKDRGKIDEEAIETIRCLFGDRVYKNIIRYQPTPVKDCSIRSEVLTEKSNKNVALDYIALCKEVIEEINN